MAAVMMETRERVFTSAENPQRWSGFQTSGILHSLPAAPETLTHTLRLHTHGLHSNPGPDSRIRTCAVNHVTVFAVALGHTSAEVKFPSWVFRPESRVSAGLDGDRSAVWLSDSGSILNRADRSWSGGRNRNQMWAETTEPAVLHPTGRSADWPNAA